MNWLEISVLADGEAAEAISEVFNRYADEHEGTAGAVVELTGFDSRGELTAPLMSVRTYVRQGPQAAALVRKVEEALWHLQMLYAFAEPTVREIAEEDWANAWKAHYQPIRLGERLFVVPSWIEAQAQPDDIVIRLDPGMAFGTGTHPSTRLCLLNLERHVRPGMRVLDVGAGSGILAIAAVKLGAWTVVGTDIDLLAVRIAGENAALNAAAERITLLTTPLPPMPAHDEDRFDIIVVNILAEVIIALLDADLHAWLRPAGHLILGGIIDTWADAVLAALDRQGYTVTAQLTDGDWVGLAAQRRARP